MAANPKHNAGSENPIAPVAETFRQDTFRMVAEARRQVESVAETAREAIKASYSDPVLLAAFIESHQTPVYVLPNGFMAAFCLWALGFEPGFITPRQGRRFQLLQGFVRFFTHFGGSRVKGEKQHCHVQHGLFVLPQSLLTVGFLSHQLHHWLAFRSGMQGYSERSQALYKKFWEENQGQLGPELYEMSGEEIMALKSAINRDLEALAFLRDIASEVLRPAQQGRRLSNQGRASA